MARKGIVLLAVMLCPAACVAHAITSEVGTGSGQGGFLHRAMLEMPVKQPLILGCVWATLVGAACLAPYLRRKHRKLGILAIMCLALNLVLLMGMVGLDKAPAATDDSPATTVPTLGSP